MPLPKIPASLLNNPDRKAAFQGIKAWIQNEWQSSAVNSGNTIPSGASVIDNALGGGYSPGHITEIVEPAPSRGVQSLLHHAIRHARQQQRYVALIDAPNQFDPQSESSESLRSLLWIRAHKTNDVVKACDILIRDGNFPLLILDLRFPANSQHTLIRSNEWYRIQRVCEQSRVAFLSFTTQSTIPCAHARLQLTRFIPIETLDHPLSNALTCIECEILKRRVLHDTLHSTESENQLSFRVANLGR